MEYDKKVIDLNHQRSLLKLSKKEGVAKLHEMIEDFEDQDFSNISDRLRDSVDKFRERGDFSDEEFIRDMFPKLDKKSGVLFIALGIRSWVKEHKVRLGLVKSRTIDLDSAKLDKDKEDIFDIVDSGTTSRSALTVKLAATLAKNKLISQMSGKSYDKTSLIKKTFLEIYPKLTAQEAIFLLTVGFDHSIEKALEDEEF